MGIKIKLKGTAGRQNTPDWYRHDTEELAGVTNLPANKLIGLDNVLVFDPSENQESNGMVCAVILKTIVGDIRATIYQSKNSPGTLYLRPPQSREENEETGEVKYHDEVKMNPKLTAQVLRYIETQVDIEVDEEAETGAGAGVGLGAGLAGNPFTVTQPAGAVPAGNVDQHAEDDDNPFAN